MQSTIPFFLATFWVVLVLPAGWGKTYLNLNPTLNSNKPRTCSLPNNITGFCVHKSICSDEHKLEVGGRVIESELRLSTDCNIPADEWCCATNITDAVVTKTPEVGVSVTPPHINKANSHKSRTCSLPNNITGFCVHKSICSDEHKLEVGGRVIESELRLSPDCNALADEWCCATNITEPDITITPEVGVSVTPPHINKAKHCIVTNKEDCPWFVKLYRNGEERPYCLGAMIGSKVILTTATCELQGRDQFLWATVPSSASPATNYTVTARLRHPKYNSGTRQNDLALFSLGSSVDWGTNGPKGACVDPQQPLAGECTAASVDDSDNLQMVSVFVTAGACSARGNVPDAACGTGIFDSALPHGTPVMCQKNNMYILSGVTKRSYDSQRAILGTLDYPWLIYNLKEIIKMEDRHFLYKKNYS